MIFGLGLLAGCTTRNGGNFDLGSSERPRVTAEADAALGDAPKTIVAAVNPRSAGGPHDWSSDADYWWPDPKNPGGPYVSRDGLTNPGNFTAHRELMLAFVRDFGALAAAYKLTGEERYAAGAVRQLHAWFVDPATRMNPNLQYAQAVRGRYTGRSYGVIDTVHFAEVALGAEALRGSRAYSPEEDAAVCGWFRQYLDWLQTSPNGSAESKAANNHGACWVLQAAAFAHLVGDQAVLERCRQRLLDDLLPNQMAADGSFPRELARTKPYGYSIFNLDVMTALAQVLSRPGENLIDYTLSDGRSLAKGIAFLAPYLADRGRWPKPPDAMFWHDWPVRQPALIFGYLAAGRSDWLETWRKLNPDPTVDEIRRNFPVRQPVLWVGLAAPARTGRETLNFDPDWRFLRADPGPAAAQPGFDDRGWARVSAPHTFNDVDTFNHWSPRTMAGQREQWSGRTWYRKTFVLGPAAAGRKTYLEFEGVRQVAEVYLNGHYLGASKNGFVPFGFDLTPDLRRDGGANVLAVMCDNRFMSDPDGPAGGQNLTRISATANTQVPESEDAIQANQIPWNNPRWHPPMGGIYRNVYLHLTDPLHLSLPLYDFLQTEGPYIYGSDFSAGAAAVNVELPVENGRDRPAAVSATVSILDVTGRAVLELRSEGRVAAGGRALFRLKGSLADPRLWEPAYPYLYRAVCRLESDGVSVDSVEIPFGLRTAVWTTAAGFFLNGHHVKLH
ncbi:MAG TPA: alginate lyase family protein, partial [Opitutaceae bacterium]|nr:alginate lyase family protein [Opitutaceae bacterium]